MKKKSKSSKTKTSYLMGDKRRSILRPCVQKKQFKNMKSDVNKI